jgi:beta-glucosidase
MEKTLPPDSYHFPRGFLWGTATSSHQVEGNNTNNNWWAWEQQTGRIEKGHKSGLACDWWGGRWQEDFDRAAAAGQNAHRLSVEWSRIQPAPDRWDEAALEQYRAMLRGLRDRNMTAMVTLHHVTDPLWLGEMGGWETSAVVPLFEKYVRRTVEALKEYCSLWCTINEPNLNALEAYMEGIYPPGRHDIRLAYKVMANLVRGHAAAYRAIHAIQPEARAGLALHYRPMVPAHAWSPLDRLVRNLVYNGLCTPFPSALATGRMDTPIGKVRIPEAKGTQDYIGLNYYSEDTVAFDITQPGLLFSRRYYPQGSDLSDNALIANIPEGFFKSLKWALQFNLPILITENGVEDRQDRLRPRYIAQHIHQMGRGIDLGWPVKGYFYWSLVDNFEWERGWTQRFGLWELDVETQARRKRPSADLYAGICKENGLTVDLVRKYCPEIYARIFPE